MKRLYFVFSLLSSAAVNATAQNIFVHVEYRFVFKQVDNWQNTNSYDYVEIGGLNRTYGLVIRPVSD